jgi:hypothetical protein
VGIVSLVVLVAIADSDQVWPSKDLGDPDFRHIEGDALDLYQHIENRVRAAGADRASRPFVEAP